MTMFNNNNLFVYYAFTLVDYELAPEVNEGMLNSLTFK